MSAGNQQVNVRIEPSGVDYLDRAGAALGTDSRATTIRLFLKLQQARVPDPANLLAFRAAFRSAGVDFPADRPEGERYEAQSGPYSKAHQVNPVQA